MKNLDVILAALGGALVGTAVGLLFAPNKGCETRAKIKEYLKTHRIKLSKEKFEQLANQIENEIATNS